jgi:hypothetical protein
LLLIRYCPLIGSGSIQIVKRVHLSNDPLLMKVLHNLVVHPGKLKEAIAASRHPIIDKDVLSEFLMETIS